MYIQLMPVLSPHAPLGFRPLRVLIAGTSGAGKTTLARNIEKQWGLPHTEIDALFHGPQWTPRETFLGDVHALANTSEWVTEWQYSSARPLLAQHADLIVWLDLPILRTMFQVTRRTIRRALTKQVLWHGNREPSLLTFFTNDEHIVRWAWRTRNKAKRGIAELQSTRPDLAIVRVRSHRSAARFVAAHASRRIGSHGAHAAGA